jgi:hydrogenase 3 maturation protease
MPPSRPTHSLPRAPVGQARRGLPPLRLLERTLEGDVLLAGVGCLGRGDDGFGPELARRLEAAAGVVAERRDSRFLALDCGDRPEDYTADIASWGPDTVVFADAVELGREPGAAILVDAVEVEDRFPDSHRASLKLVMEYVRCRTGAQVLLLGVQPVSLCGQEMSPVVAAVTERLAVSLGPFPPLDRVPSKEDPL